MQTKETNDFIRNLLENFLKEPVQEKFLPLQIALKNLRHQHALAFAQQITPPMTPDYANMTLDNLHAMAWDGDERASLEYARRMTRPYRED